MIDEEHFTSASILAENAICSVVKVPVGELSLSPKGECLSLHSSILTEEGKSGNS